MGGKSGKGMTLGAGKKELKKGKTGTNANKIMRRRISDPWR